METLWRIVQSMQEAAREADVQIITGDTKVVDKGKGDGVFINTAGIGIIEHQMQITPKSVRKGDVILLNGDIGRHGMAVMSVREGLEFKSAIESDSASVAGLVLDLLAAGVEIHCLRDLTRGGLASAMNEIAEASNTSMEIDEQEIPITDKVQGACEILGFDPLYVANEGRFIAIVPPPAAAGALEILKSHPLGTGATIIGRVSGDTSPLVQMKTLIGTSRIVGMLSGEQLPRIC